MAAKKYALTAEHRAQLEPWRDRWIANALSTAPLTAEDPARIRAAVRDLYRAANLTPPPDARIVIVPSPTVARFAGGFAAAIWYLRKRGLRRDATWAATWDATRAATWAATEAATRAATEAATRDATWDATWAATRAATEAATWDATEDATRDATGAATWAATWAATRAATEAATEAATRAATRAATEAATWAATEAATRDATWDATWAATRAATEAATEAATWDATRDATGAATRAATGAATWAATRAATEAATRAATWDATGDVDDDAWYRIPVRTLARLARLLFAEQADFALKCAFNAYNMWNGGNQWAGWLAVLTFFRYVAQLRLDYTKWQSYEVLAEYGPRVMHEEFCLVCERPVSLTVDAQSRPHSDMRPFCQWRDGTALYAIHGVRVPWWVVEHPEWITVQKIQDENNAEVRRILLGRFGFDRFVRESGALPLHADACGTLYGIDLPEDEPLMIVRVTNSTPEVDGSFKEYALRVDPQLRPLPPGHWPADRQREWLEHQQPQAVTARNAVASLFGLRGEAYQPSVES